MSKLWRILLVCSMLSLATTCWAQDQIADINWNAHPHMLWAVNFAYDQGARYGLAQTTRATIYAESTACRNKVGTDKHSYGCGQLKYQTANTIFRLYDFATKPIPVASLKTNDRLNIIIAAQYLDYCFQQMHHNLYRAIVCYNKGEVKAAVMNNKEIAVDPYLKNVLSYMQQFKAVRISHD